MTNCFHILLIALTITSCIYGSYASALEDKIAFLLDKYRDTITSGKWLLPSLDPLVWDHEKLHYINEKKHVDVEMTATARTQGMSDYHIESVKIDNQEFKIVLNIDKTESNGELVSKGQIGEHLPLNGDGNFTATIKNELITLSGKIGTNSRGFMELEDFKVLIHVDKIIMDVHGFPGGELYNRLISKLIKSAGAALVNHEEQFASNYVSPVFRKMFNPAFNQFTYEQFMDFINNA